MGGVGAHGSRAERRRTSPRIGDLLQRTCSALIRSPHQGLESAIDSAVAGLGKALAADRAAIVTRNSGRLPKHHSWERRRQNGAAVPVTNDPLLSMLATLDLGRTLVCTSRKQLPVPPNVGSGVGSGIFVPLQSNGKLDGVLAVIARTPRSWSAEAIEATEWLAEMLSAGLDRMATRSSETREQEGRLHLEGETRRLRDQLAHAGRVSMLGELAASLAHELNQPLTAIYTNAQAAHRFLDRKRPALGAARSALHDLGQDCRRAGDVLGRLRQMFRRHETERLPLAVGPLIEHVLRLLHEDAVTRGVSVTFYVEPRLPMVKGDRVQLEQVLMNLLVNAFDALTGIDGPRDVKVRASTRDGTIEMSVLDNGKGIPLGDLERVFEPFFTRKPNGMGMGLAICRTIVEAHGGRISARSRPERGSIFEISLPTMPPSPTP